MYSSFVKFNSVVRQLSESQIYNILLSDKWTAQQILRKFNVKILKHIDLKYKSNALKVTSFFWKWAIIPQTMVIVSTWFWAFYILKSYALYITFGVDPVLESKYFWQHPPENFSFDSDGCSLMSRLIAMWLLHCEMSSSNKYLELMLLFLLEVGLSCSCWYDVTSAESFD